MKICCVIVTYNGMPWMDWCLQGLRSSTITVTPVIVDNCSTDGTVAHIEQHYPECVILPQTRNLGFGQANNIGMQYAIAQGASHVLLLNQDATIQPDTIEKLLAFDDGKHLLTPVHLNGNGQQIDPLFHNRTILGSAKQNGLVEDIILRGELNSFYEVDYVNAACWLLPKAIIEQIGGFNPLFTQYGEDDNYIQRLQYHHLGLRLIPNAFIFHDRKTAHGNEKAYRKGFLYRTLLLVKTNINLSGKERFLLSRKLCIQEFGAAILAHHCWQFIGEWFSAKWKLCRNRKAIRQSRQKEI